MLHPFDYSAGLPALLIGLGVMAVLAGASYLTGIHFDGLVDTHAGQTASVTYCLIEQLLPWIIFFILIYISGRILSKSASIRLIDVAGTTAYARIPNLIQLPVTLLIRNLLPADVEAKVAQHQMPDFKPLSLVFILLVSVVAIAVIAWEVYLFYKAYSISCNIKGSKAVVSFIIVIIITEALSKYFLYLVLNQLG